MKRKCKVNLDTNNIEENIVSEIIDGSQEWPNKESYKMGRRRDKDGYYR